MRLEMTAAASILSKKPLALVLYGSDGGVREYILQEIRASLPPQSQWTRIDETGAADFDTPLHDDLFGNSGAFRCLVVDGAVDKRLKAYQKVAADQAGPAGSARGLLVLTSLKLRASSTIVQWANASPQVGAFTCYPLETPALMKVWTTQLKNVGLSASPPALQMLSAHYDLSDIPSLVALLALGDCAHLTPEVITDLLGQGQEDIQLIEALASQNRGVLAQYCAQPHPESLAALRQATTYFINLLKVQNALRQGQSLDESLQTLTPPIFFKQLPAFRRHVTQWTPEALSTLLAILADLEIALKSGSLTNAHHLLFDEALWA